VAQAAGFALVADLTDVYDGIDPATLAIGPDDFHPNADGHARLARRLDAALDRLPGRQRPWASSPRQSEGAESQ
jgi:lysophospholipase L1-like esterase